MSAIDNRQFVNVSSAFILATVSVSLLLWPFEDSAPELIATIEPVLIVTNTVATVLMIIHFLSSLIHSYKNNRLGWYIAIFLTGFAMYPYMFFIARIRD